MSLPDDPDAALSALDVERLRAFARGELDESARAEVEALIDRDAEARRVLGVLARERDTGRTRGSTPSEVRGGADPHVGSTPSEVHGGADPHIGLLLGDRYRLKERLGAGGMGTVYAAEHVLLGREVALKLLHAELAARIDVRRRFENEARAAASIDHPNVVAALDIGRTPDGVPFVVFERLAGVDLEAHLSARGALPQDEALPIARAIAAGLAAAHARGIVHRDLKPANVFLAAPDGTPKVLDFGVAKLREPFGPSTLTGAFMGTPAYMAPEQLRDARKVDARADVYALGAVLFRMLAGRLPHDARSLAELLEAHRQPAPSLRSCGVDVAPALDEVVARCLAPSVDERFADMAAVEAALAPFVVLEARAEATSTLAPADRRVVTAVFASFPLDGSVVAAAGGRLDPSGAVAIFGESTWTEDVFDAALGVAAKLGRTDGLVVVGPARLIRSTDGEGLEGAAEAAFARAEARALRGVFVTRDLARQRAELGGPRGLGPSGAEPSPSAKDSYAAASALPEHEHELLRVPEHATDVGRGREAPFVGRDVELGWIRATVERAIDDHEPVAVIVEGAPGVGKTRLATEALLGLSKRPRVRWARAHFESHGGGLGEGELIRAWLGLDEDRALDELARRDDARAVASRGLGPNGDGRSASEADARGGEGELAREPRGNAGARRAPRDDAGARLDRVRLAALERFAALARERPLVLVADDAHCASSAALAFVERLVELRADLVVVLLSRRELSPVGRAPMRLSLGGLRRREVGAFAEHLGHTLAPETLETLHEHTEGNPFFVEQILRVAPPRFDLTRRDGIPLPASVEAAVQARLDGLAPEDRALLVRASVLDEELTSHELTGPRGLGPRGEQSDSGHVSGGAEQIPSGLDRLRAAGLVLRVHHVGGPRWRVASELVRRTAVGALSPMDRANVYLAHATQLMTYADPPAARIARHLDAAGDPRAVGWHVRAADAASRASDLDAFLIHAERARALGSSEVRDALAEAYELSGRLDDEATLLEEAIATAGPSAESASPLARLAVNRLRRGALDEALALFARASSAVEAFPDASAAVRASVLGRHAVALLYAGEVDAATSRLDEAERLVFTAAPELRAEAAIWRAQRAAATGDLGDRRNAYWAAVQLYEERGDRRRRAQAAVNLADVYNRLGAYEEAERALSDAIDDCTRLGLRHAAAYAQLNLAYAHLHRARGETASSQLDRAEEALRLAHGLGAPIGDPRFDCVHALYEARLGLARGDDVREGAERMAEGALARGWPALAALGFSLAASSALARGEEALPYAERAAALLAQLGSVEEDEAEITLALARALESVGREREAFEARALGRASLLSAARRIGDPLWRERFVRDIPAHRALLADT